MGGILECIVTEDNVRRIIAAHISRMKTTFFLCLSLFQLLVTKKKIFAKFTLFRRTNLIIKIKINA